ncbi:MAG TPA: replicative DNA helicase, partial [Acidimicrobiales bacterium]|nr:replicative DNA helicase [Acidimicrobiales bacterium]
DFYKPAHGHVFDAVTALYARGEPVDPVTAADELRRAGLLEVAGGPPALISLQAATPATSNAARYARIVSDHALLRRLIGVAGEIAELGYDVPEDVDAAIDRAETMVFDVGQRRVADTLAPIRDLLSASLDRLEALYDRGEAITGVPTGYTDIDEQLAGLQPSNLVIVGARPSMGKTAWALGAAAHAAVEARLPVLFFSLEMSHLEITQRLLCAEARVDATRMRNGRLHESDWSKISHAIGRLGEAPIFVDDNPNLTVMDIRAKSRRLKSREGLSLVIVDYLQLMTGRTSAENRQVEVSEISRGLKILARELEVPVVALSQLSRNLETRADKRPMLADLRESGCMPADTRLLRADDGSSVSLGELVLSQEQPLVWSLDDRWRLVPRQVTKVFPSGIRPVFRLRLASGAEVTATGNHPFRRVDGWVPLEDLQAGDHIAVPRRLPEPTNPVPAWSDNELILLAHLLGDGSIGPNGVKYATADPANKEVVERASRELFDIEVAGKKQRNTWLLWFPSPYRMTHHVHHPIRNWLEPLGLWGSRPHNKFIPGEVMGQTSDRLALFLSHLWATDGSITTPRNGRGGLVRIYYSTASRRLADDVRTALLRLDIRSRIKRARKTGYRDSWHVSVTAKDNQERFLSLIGCHGARGDVVPAALEIVRGLKGNPNVDLVPWNDARYSRNRLAQIAEIVGDEALSELADSDVLWDQVIEVTLLGEQPTYDATVEDTHNFIAEGICAHNSLEQDSDVVMFLYRDEMYNAESPDRGTAEIIVAKHRNGPTGVARLAFLDHYARFANMARGV